MPAIGSGASRDRTVFLKCRFRCQFEVFEGLITHLSTDGAFVEASFVPERNALVQVSFKNLRGRELNISGRVKQVSESPSISGFTLNFFACVDGTLNDLAALLGSRQASPTNLDTSAMIAQIRGKLQENQRRRFSIQRALKQLTLEDRRFEKMLSKIETLEGIAATLH